MSTDTAHCRNKDCTLKDTCYRYHLHTRNKGIASYILLTGEKTECEYYLKK